MSLRDSGAKESRESPGAETEQPTGQDHGPTELAGSLTVKKVVDVAPSLEKLSDRSVYLILDSLRADKGITVQIPANTKIELEQAGLIESLTELAHQQKMDRVAALPSVQEDLRNKEETLEEAQDKVDELAGKLGSRWHRFWTFSWLGSGRLAAERQAHSVASSELSVATQEYQDASKLRSELSEMRSDLAGFVRTSEGFITLTQKGTLFVNEYETASFHRLFDVRSAYQSGVAGVWNLKTGAIEWESAYKTGVAGVWNPATETIEWRAEYRYGVAGVWNPKTEKVEWHSEFDSGVAGVWNPKREKVEWKTEYKSGVAGVWNPKREAVEWRTAYKTGVAGVWNPETEKVVWLTSYKTGIAVVPRLPIDHDPQPAP